MLNPRTIPIHHSLIRPNLLAGAERKLALINIITAAALIMGIGGAAATVTGLLMATVVQTVLVWLAKKDPQFSEVYMRHVSYQNFYPAQSSFYSKPPFIKNRN